MSLIELYIELLFDLLAVALGIALVVKKEGNLQRFYWGIISIVIGFFLAWENVDWIFRVSASPDFEYEDILNIEKMLKWFAPASIISLFPLASLRPGYLNRKRILIYFLPFLVVLIISVGYLSSNPVMTKLSSVNDVLVNLHKFDIKLRLLVFIFSIVIPFMYFFYPLIVYKTYRKASPYMYLFLSLNVVLSAIYVSFTLFINTFFFNAFGILSVAFAITFAVLFLRSENPLSIHTGHPQASEIVEARPPSAFFDIDNYLKENQSFIDSNLNAACVAQALQMSEHEIAKLVKSAGFTGFREYLNVVRLEYFKTLAMQNREKTIKELMFASGFTSRTTFYRVFSEQYGISPVKYINGLKD